MNSSRARIEPWTGNLDYDDLLLHADYVDDILLKRVLADVEKRGISFIRLTAQSPEEYVVRSLARLIGPLTHRQNDFVGDVQMICPNANGSPNSGNSLVGLGLHVDGTQHDETPCLLLFHYISGAKIGANSIFVDTAKVFADIDQKRLFKIFTNLARPDAATFSKKNMLHRGPIFYFSPCGDLVCRIRFDAVIHVDPRCVEDFQFLASRFADPQYALELKPRQGDIIVIDNWRVLHARDVVYGFAVRQHWRGWVNQLKPALQSKYLLGIRPIPYSLASEILRANQRIRQRS